MKNHCVFMHTFNANWTCTNTQFACNQFCMHILLLVADNSLDLDDYVAEPFSIYATGESWVCF